MTTHLSTISDDELDREARRVAQIERDATVELLRLLIEVERRGLHLTLGHSSLFVYCTRILRLSEQSAYRRITAARAAKRFPRLLQFLADGSLTLSSVGLLVPQLTEETVDSLVDAARFKSTREVERLIAGAFPQPDVPLQIRACPARAEVEPDCGELFAPAIEQRAAPEVTLSAAARQASGPPAVLPSKPRAILSPISARRFFLRATISEDTHDKLERVRALLRHSVPDGDVDAILNRALSLLLDHVVRARTGVGRKARKSMADVAPSGRSIPAAIKREVWLRDGGRCAFAGPDGRCGETAFLEYHHVIPFAAGGSADATNLQLRCRAHNAHEARMYFGGRHLNSARAE
jgi:hypothetical protein